MNEQGRLTGGGWWTPASSDNPSIDGLFEKSRIVDARTRMIVRVIRRSGAAGGATDQFSKFIVESFFDDEFNAPCCPVLAG